MTDDNTKIDTFLAVRRLATLTTANFNGNYPVPRPVWFEWDDATVHMFSSSVAPKIARLTADPHATVLVANEVAEPEFWVAIQGTIEVITDNPIAVVERLAERYWGPTPTDAQAGVLAYWKSNAEHLVHLRLTPGKVASGGG